MSFPTLFVEGKLELDFNLDLDGSVEMPQTPCVQPTKPTRSRRRVRIEAESSDEEFSPVSVAPTTHQTVRSRSQRVSKTVAMNKMSARRSLKIDEIDETEEQEEESDMTSDDSDESVQYK